MSVTHPETFGRYRLLRIIGRGAATVVYVASDSASGGAVALKVLVEPNAELRHRFLCEARSAARLGHVNVVAIHEVGEWADQPFVAMEHLEGRTLASLIGQHAPLSTLTRLDMAGQVASGLRHAHEAGVIHGDLRPDKVRLDGSGSVKVIDFGISRVTATAGLRLPHIPVGAFNYMSPEQLAGDVVDTRSDIYSFGVLLFELLSYQRAFPGGRDTRLLQRVMSGQRQPILALCPELPDDVVRIVDRLLDPHVPSRYDTFGAVLHDLDRARARLSSSQEKSTSSVSDHGRDAPQPPSHLLPGHNSAPAPRSMDDKGAGTDDVDPARTILRRIDELDPRDSDLSELLLEFDRAAAAVRSRSSNRHGSATVPVAGPSTGDRSGPRTGD